MSEILQSLLIRKAVAQDLQFIVQAILDAEYGGIGPIPWCALFELSVDEFREILIQILAEDLEGQEWCLSQFYIASYQGNSVAALSAWIENENGQSSSMLMSSLVYHFIPEQKRKEASERMHRFAQLRIGRTSGALQLESIHTHPDYRGNGIIQYLISTVIQEQKIREPELQQVEILLSGSNKSARKAYEKSGFQCVEEVEYPEEASEILSLYPGTSKIKMRKTLNI